MASPVDYILPPVVTAAVGALGIMLQDMRQRHDARYQESRARTDAIESVTFLEKWLQTQQLVCPAAEFESLKANARSQLDLSYSTMFDRITEARQLKAIIDRRPALLRALLLFVPASPTGWLLHLLFYVLLGATLLWSAAGVSQTNPSRPLDLFALLIFTTPLAIPLLMLRARALDVDARHRLQLSRGTPPPPQSSSSLSEA